MSTRRPPPPPPEPRDSVDPLLEVREKRRGQRMGDAYVKIVRPFEDEFERGEEGTLVASERTVLERRGWTAALRRIRTTLIGRPISSDHESHERLTKLKALAIFSSDNISSSAYATEEMMRILVLGGLSRDQPLDADHDRDRRHPRDRRHQLPQTIKAYPDGAGSYIVASDNLGTLPGLHGRLGAAHRLRADRGGLRLRRRGGGHLGSCLAVADRVLHRGRHRRASSRSATCAGSASRAASSCAPTYLYIGAIAALIGWGLFRQCVTGDLGHFAAPPSWIRADGRARWAASACSCCSVPSRRAPRRSPGSEADLGRRAGIQAAGVAQRAHDAHLGGRRSSPSSSRGSATSPASSGSSRPERGPRPSCR